MFRNALILFSLLVLILVLSAQQSMDFYPPSLKKELQKTDSTTTKLNELILSDNARSQVPMGNYFTVANTDSQFVYIGRVNACRAGGCEDPSIADAFGETFEYFDYYILFDSSYTVMDVKVYNYQATHGQEISSKNWLKQFRHYDGSKKLVTGKNIDGISGATISVEAIVYDIEHKTNLLREVVPNQSRSN